MRENVIFLEKAQEGLEKLVCISEIKYQYNVRNLVYQYNKIKLYHYQPIVKKPHSIPLLIVFATVNRPEILDLFPERSFIRRLLENGVDVYLLDWGYPSIEDKTISMSDYVTRYLHHCVQYIIEASRQENINLLGICQGGILCLCYSILFENIKKLILISTPIDFHTKDNVIGKLFQQIDIDAFIDVVGNVSGPGLTQFFISLKPFELVGKKYLRFKDNVNDKTWVDNFLRVEKWLYDAPDQTGVAFTELVKDFYQQNKLLNGEIYMNGQRINLQQLTIPILNIMASQDQIVPISATRHLKKYIGSKHYTQKIFPSGHIGIYISDKLGNSVPDTIANWLKRERSNI